MEYKTALSLIAIVIAFLSFIPYFRDIFAGRTKPHAFSWFVWAVITGSASAIQVAERGGVGAGVAGSTSLLCFVIFLLALFKGKRHFHIVDWVSFLAALVSLALWWLAKSPISAIILLTLTDALGYIPTFRKGYSKPYEDTAATFGFNGLAFFISLFALETWKITTWLYPASLVLTNGSFVTMLYIRRKQLKK